MELTWANWILFFLACVTPASGLTKVFAECPRFVNNSTGPVNVTVKSDEKFWDVYAYCEPSATRLFGEYRFDSKDIVTKTIQIHFNREDPEHCLFIRSEEGLYQIFVEIYLPSGDKPYTITCYNITETPGDKGNVTDSGEGPTDALITSGVTYNLTEPIIGPEGNPLYIPMGGPAQSDLALYMVDILNQPVGNRPWRFGRYLKLAAELIRPRGNEVSFQVWHCTALAVGSDQRQDILQRGCGTGVTIPKTKGFETKGRMAYSVPFKGHHLLASFKTKFLCSFLVCTENCDGASCEFTPVHPQHPNTQKRDARPGVTGHAADPSRRNKSRDFLVLERSRDDFVDIALADGAKTELPKPTRPVPENAFGISRIDVFIGLAFILALVSVVTTLSFIVCRWVDTRPPTITTTLTRD